MNKTKMHNMATTHPRLLSWFASKNPLLVFVKIIPLIALYSYGATLKATLSLGSLGFFILGIFIWSLFEYITHRWVYHTIFKNNSLQWFLEAFHLHHHHNMKDYRVLNAGLLLIYPLALFFSGLVFLITNSIPLASFFGLGNLCYYFFYENVHYYIHYKVYTKGYMQLIQKYHLYHHYNKWNKNYGNTISLWDRIFNTYDASYKDFVLTEAQLTDLITIE